MIQFGYKKIAINLIRYVKENWGSPFIVGFMVLLLTDAVSLSTGSPSSDIGSFTNNLAVWSYYALVVGIFLEVASFSKRYGTAKDVVSV